MVLLVLVWLQHKRLAGNAHNILFWVEDRILIVKWVILIESLRKHGLLHNSYNSIWTLLWKWHLLLFFSHSILFHEWRLAGSQQIAGHVIKRWVRNLVHIAERASNILFRINTDINQIRLVLLIVQVVISALAATLSTCILSVTLALVCTRQRCLHRILARLRRLWRETMWHSLVKLFDPVVLLTWWKLLRSL